jgi:hypothetical protein
MLDTNYGRNVAHWYLYSLSVEKLAYLPWLTALTGERNAWNGSVVEGESAL